MNVFKKFNSKACLLLVILLLAGCDWRTPSKERFTRNCHLNFPPDVTVLRDDYQDTGRDYTIYYSLKLTATEINTLTSQIRKLEIFQDIPPSDSAGSKLSSVQNVREYWYKSKKTYNFYKENDRTVVIASLDTTSLIANFEEYSL